MPFGGVVCLVDAVATRVESIIGNLGSAGHCVAVDSAVQLNYCGLGGH